MSAFSECFLFTYNVQVQKETDESVTVCKCSHLTTFGGGWIVMPNTIDWSYVFANADFLSNPTLYITEIVIAVAYIGALIWARRKDKKDVEEVCYLTIIGNIGFI